MRNKTQKLIICTGLPGSGKSTWAKEQVDNGNGEVINVCKDDLRLMFHFGKHSKGREEFIVGIRDYIIEKSLLLGKDVISSDCNFGKHIDNFVKKFGGDQNIKIEIKDFTDVPYKECIDRDIKRGGKVGDKVIKDMYNRFIKKEPNVLEQDKTLPKAVIFDIDGTLAHMTDRKPYEWHKVGEDLVDEELAQMARDMYLLGNWILIVSGRDEACRKETIEWLNKHKIPYNALFMRSEGDNRRDSIIKKEIFFNYIQPNWYVRFVFDDRDQVVNEAWREIGIKCYQVAEGDF